MSLPALALVLAAAFLHAVWNLYAKRAAGGFAFVSLVGLVNVVLYAPFVAVYWAWRHPVLPSGVLLWVAGSGVLKSGYALFLQRAYRTGDFSLIYPLARGTAPILATIAALVILGERPSALAAAGGIVIVGSIFILAGGTALFGKSVPHARSSAAYGLAAAAFVAAYTVWDRRGVSSLAVAPLLFDAGTTVAGVLLLAPVTAARLPEIAREWREHRTHAIAVAGLSSVSYILVLTALAVTPVSYVAPMREVSIVFGAFIGTHRLGEAGGRRRILSAAAIAAGIILMAVG